MFRGPGGLLNFADFLVTCVVAVAMAQLEYKELVLVKKGVRVRLNELHVGAESGWRDGNKKMIEQEANMGTLASEVNQDSYYDNPNVVKVKTSELLDFQNFPMAINFQRKISMIEKKFPEASPPYPQFFVLP